jgi:hypothetical protein
MLAGINLQTPLAVIAEIRGFQGTSGFSYKQIG